MLRQHGATLDMSKPADLCAHLIMAKLAFLQGTDIVAKFCGVTLQAGCSAIANLCKQLPSDALRPQHDALLASLLPNLGHQHSRVRISTLAALDTLVTKVQILLMASTFCTALFCCSERRERLLLCLDHITYGSIVFSIAETVCAK